LRWGGVAFGATLFAFGVVVIVLAVILAVGATAPRPQAA
jgi:hypothetical protein